jgi:hypothetical protein
MSPEWSWWTVERGAMEGKTPGMSRQGSDSTVDMTGVVGHKQVPRRGSGRWGGYAGSQRKAIITGY